MTDPTGERHANKEIVRQFLALIAVGDLRPAFDNFVTDDVEWWLPPSLPNGGNHIGKKAVLTDMMLAGGANVEVGTMSMEVRSIVGDDDTDMVAAEWTSRFSTKKGADYENQYNVMFTLRDGKIATVREYLDTTYSNAVLWA